jgi:hypothetical protein
MIKVRGAAALGFGFEGRCDPRPRHLIAGELAADSPVLVLVPAQVPVGVDAGPAEQLVLAAAAGGPQLGSGIGELLVR